MKSKPPQLMKLLKEVSRSFYLTMRVLPGSIRMQISAAYLLARATDTIADTELIPAEVRVEVLQRLRAAILAGQSSSFVEGDSEVSALLQAQAETSEKTLLENVGEVIRRVEKFSAEDRADIHAVLETITEGQLMDLQRFVVGREPETVRALQTEEELDEYTYSVAGCVGEFWTRICRRHLYPRAVINEEKLFENAIHFGKGLQLVNILRDLPADLKNGRCYLPEESLRKLDLSVDSLRNPDSYPFLRTYYKWYLAKALFYLQDGAQYLEDTPGRWRTWLMRLGCTWPILIGAKTLKLLGETNPLDPSQKVKVTRKEVKSILFSTILRGFIPGGWKDLFEQTFKEANRSVVCHNRTVLPHDEPSKN
jgi:farnesyl-diphosphate farnesyltransferase